MKQTVSRWVIDHNADATRQCHSKVAVGTGCNCIQCRNFEAAEGQTFPPEFVSLLDEFGIDPLKPVELCHYCREPSGLYLTGGWFHLVGSIVSGSDVLHWEGDTGTFHFERLVPGLEFGFSDRLALVRESFAGLPLVQCEFQTRVPWVLAELEPHIGPDT